MSWDWNFWVKTDNVSLADIGEMKTSNVRGHKNNGDLTQ